MGDMENQKSDSLKQEVNNLITEDETSKRALTKKKPDTWFLYFTMLAACLQILGAGTIFTWSSPVLPKLISNDTNINPLIAPATTMQISIMMALPSLVSFIGSLLTPIISDYIGRKRTLQFTALIITICDICIAFSNRIIYITIARCFYMTTLMGCLSIFVMFIMEVCENHNRGKYGCMFGVFIPLGQLYSYVFGPFFTVKMFTLITTVPVVLWLLLSVFIDETPIFLLRNGKKEECLKALRKLRSNKSDVEIEIDFKELKHSLTQRTSSKNATISSFLQTKSGRIGLAIATLTILLQTASGAPILVSFIGPIFNSAQTGLTGNAVAILVGSIKVVSFGITTSVVEKFGRRTLLIFSSFGCGITLVILGCFFYLLNIDSPLLKSLPLLPIFSILSFFVLYSSGLGPLSPLIIGELFSNEFRSVALSIITTSHGVLLFAINFIFPFIITYVGLHWGFWMFSIFSFIGCFGIYFILPETRGRSIIEIQEILENYKFEFKKPV